MERPFNSTASIVVNYNYEYNYIFLEFPGHASNAHTDARTETVIAQYGYILSMLKVTTVNLICSVASKRSSVERAEV